VALFKRINDVITDSVGLFLTQLWICMLHDASPVTQMYEQQGAFPLFSLADKCSSYNHGCRAGVCHPAQHDWQTAFRPGTLCFKILLLLVIFFFYFFF